MPSFDKNMNQHIGTIGNVTLKPTILFVGKIRATLTTELTNHHLQEFAKVTSIQEDVFPRPVMYRGIKATHILIHV
jgi:hypothetical protein